MSAELFCPEVPYFSGARPSIPALPSRFEFEFASDEFVLPFASLISFVILFSTPGTAGSSSSSSSESSSSSASLPSSSSSSSSSLPAPSFVIQTGSGQRPRFLLIY